MSEEKKETEVIDVEGLGRVELVSMPKPAQTTTNDAGETETIPAKPGVFRMNQSDLIKFYETHGVPNAKTVLDAVDNAAAEFGHVACKSLLQPRVEETGLNWELHAGNVSKRLDVSLVGTRKTRDVSTGQERISYGVATMKRYAPNPFKGDWVAEMQAEIEAAVKKQAGLV